MPMEFVTSVLNYHLQQPVPIHSSYFILTSAPEYAQPYALNQFPSAYDLDIQQM